MGDLKGTRFLIDDSLRPPTHIQCSPFGTVVNHQYKPFLKYINDLKKRTDWREGEDILPIIPNYVMNMTFESDLHFRSTDLALTLPNTYFKPDEFPAPTLRILKTACLVFDNGKLVITGGQSDNNVIYAAYQYRRQLMKIVHLVKVLNEDGTPKLASEDELVQPKPPCPIPPNTRPNVKKQVYALTTMEKLMKFKNFNLVNVVGTGIASILPIHLANMSNIMVTSVSDWQPELFPGLGFIIRRTHCPIKVS
jgi:TATA-box binding protein (TBP) (component of TFIID and TFIIIB)